MGILPISLDSKPIIKTLNYPIVKKVKIIALLKIFSPDYIYNWIMGISFRVLVLLLSYLLI